MDRCFYYVSVSKHYDCLPIIEYLLCIVYVLGIIYNHYISLEGRYRDQNLIGKKNEP